MAELKKQHRILGATLTGVVLTLIALGIEYATSFHFIAPLSQKFLGLFGSYSATLPVTVSIELVIFFMFASIFCFGISYFIFPVSDSKSSMSDAKLSNWPLPNIEFTTLAEERKKNNDPIDSPNLEIKEEEKEDSEVEFRNELIQSLNSLEKQNKHNEEVLNAIKRANLIVRSLPEEVKIATTPRFRLLVKAITSQNIMLLGSALDSFKNELKRSVDLKQQYKKETYVDNEVGANGINRNAVTMLYLQEAKEEKQEPDLVKKHYAKNKHRRSERAAKEMSEILLGASSTLPTAFYNDKDDQKEEKDSPPSPVLMQQYAKNSKTLQQYYAEAMQDALLNPNSFAKKINALVNKIDLYSLQLHVLKCFILGESDMNFGNILLVKAEDSDNYKIQTIDFEEIMPESNITRDRVFPFYKSCKQNRFTGAISADKSQMTHLSLKGVIALNSGLLALPGAEKPFVRELLEYLSYTLDVEKLISYHRATYRKNGFNKKQIEAQLQRVVLLKQVIDTALSAKKITLTPRKLYSIFQRRGTASICFEKMKQVFKSPWYFYQLLQRMTTTMAEDTYKGTTEKYLREQQAYTQSQLLQFNSTTRSGNVTINQVEWLFELDINAQADCVASLEINQNKQVEQLQVNEIRNFENSSLISSFSDIPMKSLLQLK